MTTGSLFIISAPSGTGKTSLIKSLIKTDGDVRLSVSYTTRLPRPAEREGEDYHFVSHDMFGQMESRGEFLESAEVYGNHYGTSKKWIEATMTSGHDILLEIDSQGAQQVRRIFPQAIGIFVLPPSLEMLETRLKARSQDSPEVIRRRVAAAREEIRHVREYDYVIINAELDTALQDFASIIRAERVRLARQLVRYHTLIAV
jgi:guanylate kinase